MFDTRGHVYKFLDKNVVVTNNKIKMFDISSYIGVTYYNLVDKVLGIDYMYLSDWIDDKFHCEKYIIKTDQDTTWFKNGVIHRGNDKPAIISTNGEKRWYHYGLHHRGNDKPGTISSSGDKIYMNHGRIHRGGDKPAFEMVGGSKIWYLNGYCIVLNYKLTH